MSTRRTLSLLAALALLSPLAATAAPACAPGAMAEHCPMMAVLADEAPPCHGAAIQADDCCPDAAAAEPAAAVPVVGVTVVEAGASVAAPSPPPAGEVSLAAAPGISPAPLYRLYRALLI